MKKGREFDALIASRVMGWRHENNNPMWLDDGGSTGYQEDLSDMPPSNRIFAPTREIADAWQVAEEVTKRYHVSLRLVGPEYVDSWVISKGWRASFVNLAHIFTEIDVGPRADTPALAICRAAYEFVRLRETENAPVVKPEDLR